MEAIKWCLLGVLQGVLEWLPVSSTGIVLLVAARMGIPPRESYNIALALHVGTLLALLVALRKDYARIALQSLNLIGAGGLKEEVKFLSVVTLATGVTGVPAYLLANALLENIDVKSLSVIISALLASSALLSVKRIKRRKELDWKTATLLGVAQGIAALPGLSRSGLTIATLMSLGFEADEAFKWSYLAAGPAVLGALALELLAHGYLPTLESSVAIAAAAFAGLATIRLALAAARVVPRSVLAVLVAAGILISALF